MSRNSKNARLMAKAREISALHKKGEKGPKSTGPQHGKAFGYRDNPKRLADAQRASDRAAGVSHGGRPERTAGRAILAKAGGASKPGSQPAGRR
jgi:hypothetical protein